MRTLSFAGLAPFVRRFSDGVRWFCVAMGCLVALAGRMTGAEVATAVFSRVSDDYVRAKQADGFFAPEPYAFGEGGFWTGPQKDESIEKLKFEDVARTIAGPLAGQNYLPTRNNAETKLLILVYWGTTTGSLGSPAASAYRDFLGSNTARQSAPTPLAPTGAEAQVGAGPSDSVLSSLLMTQQMQLLTDNRNAEILGFTEELKNYEPLRFTAAHIRRDDLYEEVGHDRYFVVLLAYDFQVLRKEKKHKLVWEARYSIDEGGNDFSQQLAAMSQAASRYFGRASDGLKRQQLPETNVQFGEFKVINYQP